MISRYGYKKHDRIDRRYHVIRSYLLTDTIVHDSQILVEILTPANTTTEVWRICGVLPSKS